MLIFPTEYLISETIIFKSCTSHFWSGVPLDVFCKLASNFKLHSL